MKPEALVDDLLYLTLAFPEEAAYKTAVVNTAKAMRDITRNKVTADRLSGAFEGWESFHYQPKVGQGITADMRLVFKRASDDVFVLGFGHRYVPSDLYRRVSALRNEREPGSQWPS